jgi:hypothetical protein
MNLAFPAICILLLALPGIILRKAFARAAVPTSLFQGKTGGYVVNKYPVSVRSTAEEVSLSLIWAVILHIIWLTGATLIGLAQPDYHKVILIVHGSSDIKDPAYQAALNYIVCQRTQITVYFLTLYAFSFFVGRTALWVIRRSHLDHKLFLFRLEDQWFYFLRGEIFNFREFDKFIKPPRPEICGTYVSVVVAQTGKDYLYKGFLWDFHLDRNGNLERIVLHHTIRSLFAPEISEAKSTILPSVSGTDTLLEPAKKKLIGEGSFDFQTVTSQLFTVRYADCKTLACTYFYIRRAKTVLKKQADQLSASLPVPKQSRTAG